MKVRIISAARWDRYEAITDCQKYFVYRILELLNENIPLYLDVPLLTFRSLLAEVQSLFEEARAGRVYPERIRELLQGISRLLGGGSVWSEILGNEASDLLTHLKKADTVIGAQKAGGSVLNAKIVRTAELACIGLSSRLEAPDGLAPVIDFIKSKLLDPGARYAYADKLAVILVSESLHAGFSKRALLRLARWCFLEATETPSLGGRLDRWRDFLRNPPHSFSVTIPCTLSGLIDDHPPHGCTITSGRKRTATLSTDAKDAWSAASLAYERLLDILEPYGVAQSNFEPTVARSGIKVMQGDEVFTVDLPPIVQRLPDFSIDQVLALESRAQNTPASVHLETMNALRASLAQFREGLDASAESRLLHMWIATETLLGSHRASSITGVLGSLPIFVAFWSIHKRLEDLWKVVQPMRPGLGTILDSVDKGGTSSPDMREWMHVLVGNATIISDATEAELVKGRLLWMSGSLNRALDRTRPLGNYLHDLADEVTHEIHYLTRIRGRLVHRGRAEQLPHYAARRLGAYFLVALNAIVFALARTPSQSLETILSSYAVAFETADSSLRANECTKADYGRFIAPTPPFI